MIFGCHTQEGNRFPTNIPNSSRDYPLPYLYVAHATDSAALALANAYGEAEAGWPRDGTTRLVDLMKHRMTAAMTHLSRDPGNYASFFVLVATDVERMLRTLICRLVMTEAMHYHFEQMKSSGPWS